MADFLLRLLMVYGGHLFPTFPDPEHARLGLKPWDFKVVKEECRELRCRVASRHFRVFFLRGTEEFTGSTASRATYYVTLKNRSRRARMGVVSLQKSARQVLSNTSTGRARLSRR